MVEKIHARRPSTIIQWHISFICDTSAYIFQNIFINSPLYASMFWVLHPALSLSVPSDGRLLAPTDVCLCITKRCKTLLNFISSYFWNLSNPVVLSFVTVVFETWKRWTNKKKLVNSHKQHNIWKHKYRHKKTDIKAGCRNLATDQNKQEHNNRFFSFASNKIHKDFCWFLVAYPSVGLRVIDRNIL